MLPFAGIFCEITVDEMARRRFRFIRRTDSTSHVCAFEVAQRDDGADVLFWLRDSLGLGVLAQQPAKRTSCPQIIWKLSAREEALELCRILERAPLRSRKRHDFVTWRQAVEANAAGGPHRFTRMECLRQELLALRAYRRAVPRPEAQQFPVRGLVWPYLAGLIAAEGCLSVSGRSARLTVKMRQDDSPFLRGLRDYLNYGTVRDYENSAGNPIAVWNVTALCEVWSLSRQLAPFMRGRKAEELKLWTRAIDEVTALRASRTRGVSRRLAGIEMEFRTMRTYVPPPPAQLPRPARGRRLRCDPLEALRQWAATTDGPLSATAYVRYRTAHPHLPTRNTLANNFGSWHAALVAAGLGDRAVRPPSAWAPRVAKTAPRRAAEVAQRRRAVLEAVAAYQAAGGPLTLTDFVAWARVNAPECPRQATIYRLFPGGWSEVLLASRVVTA